MKNSGIRLLVILLLYLFSCAQQEGGGNLSNQEEITAIENLFGKVMEASRKGDFEMYLRLLPNASDRSQVEKRIQELKK